MGSVKLAYFINMKELVTVPSAFFFEVLQFLIKIKNS